MPDIFSNTNDGKIYTGNVSGHSAARGASTGTATANENLSNAGVKYFKTSGRGAATVAIARSFFFFDTSGVTGTVSSATLNISFASNNQNFNIIIIKSDAFGGDGGTALANDDFNNVDFSTPYASALATGGSSTGTATFTLNATALTDIKNNNAFIVALLESDHDFSDSDPGDINKTLAIKFSEQSGTSSDPKLSYTLATGYSHDIMAVAAASIGKVNTVATANVGKVSGI